MLTFEQLAFAKRIHLKVKIVSLMRESKYIKQMEARHPSLIDSLHRHRVVEVRLETRAAQLVYAMIRGKPRRYVERSRSIPPGAGTNFHERQLRAAFLRIMKKFALNVTQEEALYWYDGVRDDPKVPRVMGDTTAEPSLIVPNCP